MRHIIPISGKDSLVTAIVQLARAPLPYEFIYNDTRAELPETYAWLDKVEEALGIIIQRCGASLEDIIYKNGILPSSRIRFCTKEAKIHPMHDFIGDDEATIYIGIRADEGDRIGAREERNIRVSYPLKEMGINLPMVYRILGDRDLLPPAFFWKRLYKRVCALSGPLELNEIEALPRWAFDRVFAWRSRPNCYFCFYQRLYEFVGLLEHHPELFNRAEQIEHIIGFGEATEKSAYYWIRGYPLRRIRDEAERIFETRVAAVCKMFNELLQKDLFAEVVLDGIDVAQTSCGLYCGK